MVRALNWAGLTTGIAQAHLTLTFKSRIIQPSLAQPSNAMAHKPPRETQPQKDVLSKRNMWTQLIKTSIIYLPAPLNKERLLKPPALS